MRAGRSKIADAQVMREIKKDFPELFPTEAQKVARKKLANLFETHPEEMQKYIADKVMSGEMSQSFSCPPAPVRGRVSLDLRP